MINLQSSLAGFNTSGRANRSSVKAFIASYIKAFPKREAQVWKQAPELYEWMEAMLGKGKKLPKSAKSEKQEWVPPSHYIPEYANPRASYMWQAANIARDMRKALDAENR